MSIFPLKNSCFVTSVTLASLKAFGLESLDWEPEILRDAFQEQFELRKMSQKLFDKLNCGYTLVGTNAFPASIEGFLSSTAIMNNQPFEEDEIPYCSLENCAWSVWEYMNLIGETKNGAPTEEFAPDIIAYIQETGKINGVTEFPTYLAFANRPDGSMPDLTGDADAFMMYEARQKDYINRINRYVADKQARLNEELTLLKNARLIG